MGTAWVRINLGPALGVGLSIITHAELSDPDAQVRTQTGSDSDQGRSDGKGGIETEHGCFSQKKQHMQRPQGRHK